MEKEGGELGEKESCHLGRKEAGVIGMKTGDSAGRRKHRSVFSPPTMALPSGGVMVTTDGGPKEWWPGRSGPPRGAQSCRGRCGASTSLISGWSGCHKQNTKATKYTDLNTCNKARNEDFKS